MCGICGIVDFTGAPIDRPVLESMRDEMTSRGPDDCGTLIQPFAGLAHRRLAIIDLSPRGRQPMTLPDGHVAVVYNGEIYNFRELRRELEAAGREFRSDTDTEVLLHGYEVWGIEPLLERINGMFAFALWDGRARRLLLARDRLGKKPLYFIDRGPWFAFASEIKALRHLSGPGWDVRPESLARFLYWGWIPGPETIFEGVNALLPAHYMWVEPQGSRAQCRYWKLSFARKAHVSGADALAETDRVVGEAVGQRLVSDVPLGAFLSGGVDSSIVVAHMVERSVSPVRTFTVGLDDESFDERPHALAVAQHLRTEHRVYQVRADAWSLLPRLVWECGQPFGDAAIVPTCSIARCARGEVTVVLTGDGGDESFAGYSQHRGRALGDRLGRFAPRWLIERLQRSAAPVLDSGSRGRLSSAARFLRYASSDPLVNWAAVGTFSLHHLARVWSPRLRFLTSPDILVGFAEVEMSRFDGTDPLDRALYFDLHLQLPFAYNVKVDVATMTHSLEARCPFLSREVVEWAARLPPRYKLRGAERKWILKVLAARRVPRQVVYRPKHGFSTPVGGWFRGPWAGPARSLILGETARSRGYFDYEYLERLWAEHRSGRANHGVRFWLLVWLELWHRLFVDGTLNPSDILDPKEIAAAEDRRRPSAGTKAGELDAPPSPSRSRQAGPSVR